MICQRLMQRALVSQIATKKRLTFRRSMIPNRNIFGGSSAKVDIFKTINHDEKINENDKETQKLLSPLNEKIENDEKDDHDHEEQTPQEDEMEQEDMFVKADVSLGHNKTEWGGPRRGGRYSEPTRFGDWERKGRCTDF